MRCFSLACVCCVCCYGCVRAAVGVCVRGRVLLFANVDALLDLRNAGAAGLHGGGGAVRGELVSSG